MAIRGVAKRGYPIKFPENTLSSFQAAMDLNFTHVELDVQLTKDDIPVVICDDSIDRMTNGYGLVHAYIYDELQQFTINHDERIPTLEEVLRLLKGNVTIGIELKSSHSSMLLEEKVLDIINQLDCREQVYLSSTNPHVLDRLRIRSKDIALGFLVRECQLHDYDLLKELHATYYEFPFSLDVIQQLDDEVLEKLHIQVIVQSVNTIEQMKTMRHYPKLLAATNELEKFQAIYYPETITNWQKVGI